MPSTPAKRHLQRTQARDAASAAARGDPGATNQYELMLLQLADHRRRLKDIQSIERKIVLKRTLLPDYQAYIDGVLASDAGVQDDVLMTLLVWHIDVGDIAGALRIGAYALRHGLLTPEQYRRDTATLLAEEAAELSLRTEGGAAPDLLLEVLAVTEGHDMPDEVRAKLHKALGLALTDADPHEALAHLNRALVLHDKAGVKKLIEQLERTLAKTQT